MSSVWFEKRTIYPLFFILTRKLSPSWIARLVGKVEIQGGSSCASLLEHPVVSFHKSTEIFLNSKFTGCPNWQGTSVSFNFGRIPVDFGPHTEQWLINASRRNLFFLVVCSGHLNGQLWLPKLNESRIINIDGSLFYSFRIREHNFLLIMKKISTHHEVVSEFFSCFYFTINIRNFQFHLN